ncbi:MAG: VOC family protein [Actinobacteria bacterium]|nr:MAG: VOC family protein [Actinomycetota bacterium]
MNPVVHLELHTSDLPGACAAYAQLCGWRAEEVPTGSGSYTALALGERFGGGVVECGTSRAMWLPYVRVSVIEAATARARELGASVLLEPREGPAGWRAVVSTPAAGEVAFWQPKVWVS